MLGGVMFGEVAAGEQWNAKGTQPSRRNVIGRRALAFGDRRHVAVRAGEERCASPATERNTGTDGRFLQAWRGLKRPGELIGEPGSCRFIWILRLWHYGEARPEICELEARILLAKPDK